MALSTPKVRRIRDTQAAALFAIQVKSGATIYQGSFAGIGASYDATAANQGRVLPYNDANGLIYAGMCQGGGGSGTSQGQSTVVGDATENNVVSLDFGSFVVERTTVTDVTAYTDIGRLVYLTDDDVMTLTAPAAGGVPIGMVVGYYSTTYVDVLCFSVEAVVSIAMSGGSGTMWNLGSYDWVSIANGDILTELPAPFAGRITQFGAIIDIALTGTSGTATLNMEIGTTNVGPTTPTTIVLSTAATPTKGLVVESAAITANNSFAKGSLISIEAASVATTRTTGRFNFYAIVERGPGI